VDENGLLPDDPEWLRQELGLSHELIEDLVAWARDWDQPPSRVESDVVAWIERMPERKAEGRRLFEQLKAEISPQFTLVDRFDMPLVGGHSTNVRSRRNMRALSSLPTTLELVLASKPPDEDS
jgi:hypothetical protein